MSIEALKRQIRTAKDLLSVVRTMKSLASVNIRQYERAVAALADYARTVDLAWLALFQTGGGLPRAEARGSAVVLAIGSDQGMAGGFNDALLERALSAEPELNVAGPVSWWVSGERILAGLLDEGRDVQLHFSLPSSLAGIDPEVRRIVEAIGEHQHERGVRRFYLLHNAAQDGAPYVPQLAKLLPLDREWASRFETARWPARNIPHQTLPPEMFFEHLFGQYLFVSLYRAYGRSLAAENAARLAAMQAAEKNIEELQDQLEASFRQTRQEQITSELLDVVSGFEAMQSQDDEPPSTSRA